MCVEISIVKEKVVKMLKGLMEVLKDEMICWISK